jgi:hypothetical protein
MLLNTENEAFKPDLSTSETYAYGRII